MAHFYQQHIGDYSKDTAHLSMLEHGAYRLMLDIAYATEKPLPRDQQAIYRLVRARTHAEKLAVDVILGEFWTESNDGWRNKRVDEELAKAAVEGEEAKLKRENEAERQKRHRERRKKLFDELRARGEVPKWDTSMEDLEALLSRVLKRDSNAPVTGPVTRTATAIHYPLPNTHKTTPLPPSGGFVRFWSAWPSSTRKASRGKCEQVWTKGGFDAFAEQIVSHVEAMKSSMDWRKEGGAFIPAPLVYLNQRRWEGADARSAAPELRLAV